MGCTQSKIENEEAVSRCKERKQFMKEAVSARNAFAAAHSAHAMALKNTGAALSDYAHGEVLNPQLAQSTTNPPTQPFDSIRPPPPFPEMPLAPPPLQRAVTMPEFSIPQPDTKPPHPVIIEEENEDEIENDGSSGSSSLRRRSSRGNNRSVGDDDGAPPQPPSPPRPLPNNHHRDLPPPPQPPKESPWDFGDFFFSAAENMPGPSLSEVEEEVSSGKEEIERKVFDERSTRVEDSRVEAQEPPKVVEPPPKAVKNVRQSSSALANVEGKRSGKGAANVNLLKMLNDLDDHFLKASESAHEVSNMLEANRVHYHSNFADGRGHIDHSARVMRVITWNRSFRGLPNADDGKDDFDLEERETHATVLDKLLAWEKKLYDEVKAGELMKFEYQRKVTLLNKQKKRSTNSEALEKTKAAVSHLHTRYIVDMQSMDSTVSEINRLRDDQLYPKLVELVEGMATMWETMRVQHESQSNIVEDLKYLGISQSSKETSEHHHERTIQLWAVVEGWHAQFAKLVINQKDYIKALNNWLKLNLIPIESSLKEKVSSPPRPQNPPIQSLLRAWHDYLDKLPDDHAKSAIFNFGAVIHSIVQYQEDEIKLKIKCEDTRKELARKTRQFEDWYNKYMQRRTPPDEMDPDRAEDNTHKDAVAEKQFAVDTVKKRLEDEEAAYLKQCLQVREKSLTSLKTRLPELFRALSDFARSCSDMYRNLSSISQFQNPSESSS